MDLTILIIGAIVSALGGAYLIGSSGLKKKMKAKDDEAYKKASKRIDKARSRKSDTPDDEWLRDRTKR